jgi:hypothetical protein
MNNPRLVLPLLNIVEIIKSKTIRARLITAMIEPIIVNQFLDEDGNFTAGGLGYYAGVKISK